MKLLRAEKPQDMVMRRLEPVFPDIGQDDGPVIEGDARIVDRIFLPEAIGVPEHGVLDRRRSGLVSADMDEDPHAPRPCAAALARGA
jgi:hypothetical protein